MCDITTPHRINQIVTLFHRYGLWRQEDETASRKTFWKLIYLIFHVSFVVSVAAGGFLSDDRNECIFLISAAVQLLTVTVKLIYIIWKKKEILAFLHNFGVHSVTNHDEFTKINKRLNRFMKFVSCFIFLMCMQILFLNIFLPLFSREKILPLNVALTLDWKNSDMVYWIAYAFVVIGLVITAIAVMLNPVIWYLLMNCSIKYQILGDQFRNMGSVTATKPTDKKRKLTEVEKQELFLNELIGLIEVHQNIREKIDQFKLCFSKLFFAQIITSGVCICGTVYVLAFNSNANLLQNVIYAVLLFYNIFDIFMVMYFGNEIKLASDRLSYCLFESNWIEQSKSCKKCIIILSEVLKQPHQLVIGKLYPLDLVTFIAILNLAYSMFNILRNLN